MCETRHSFSLVNLTYGGGQEGSPSSPVGFKEQDYVQLRDTCLHTGRLFVDSTFPPNSQSLGDLPDLSSWREAQVEWLRPHVTSLHSAAFFTGNLKRINILRCFFLHFGLSQEILKLQNSNEEPVFCLDGASRFDFSQGVVGKREKETRLIDFID